MKLKRKLFSPAIFGFLLSVFISGEVYAASENEKVVNLYSSRHYGVDNELFELFKKQAE